MSIKYLPEVCPQSEECHKNGSLGFCKNGKDDIEYICDHWDRSVMNRHDDILKQHIAEINKWNECIKKIPQIDKYSLEGIKCWHVFMFELIPETYGDDYSDKLFIEEGKKLVEAGFDLGFNEDYGVGHIIKEDNNLFTIELHVYGSITKPLEKVTLDKALEWIISFHNTKDEDILDNDAGKLTW